MSQPYTSRSDSRSLEFEYANCRNQRGSLFFMLIWESAWTVGCVLLILHAIKENKTELWLFSIPFVLSWLFGLSMLLNFLFGKQTGKLDSDGFHFRHRILCYTAEKRIPLSDLREFRVQKEVSHSSKGRTSAIWLVELQTTERPLRLAAQSHKSDLHDWLVENGNSLLRTLQSQIRNAAKPSENEAAQDSTISLKSFRQLEQDETATLNELVDDSRANEYNDEPGACGNDEEMYTLSDAIPTFHQSELSHWTKWDEFSELIFSSRGRLRFDSLPILIFVCLFWNGIVSVFLYSLFCGTENVNAAQRSSCDWLNNLFIGAFLTPFVLVGLVFFWTTLVQLFAPATVRRITFTRTEIHPQTFVLGIPVAGRRFNIESVEAFVLNNSRKSDPLSINDSCQLTFLNAQGDSLGKIKGLTLADARWLMVEFRHLFGR